MRSSSRDDVADVEKCFRQPLDSVYEIWEELRWGLEDAFEAAVQIANDLGFKEAPMLGERICRDTQPRLRVVS